MVDFRGAYTAIVTPFKGTGIKTEVDYDGYLKLIEFQNRNRISGIIPCGTTGESPTTSHEEHNKLITLAIEHCKSQVIAGTGSNATWEAIEMSRHAADAGATATLQVCPYYNKPNQEGLFRHFGEIAQKIEIPHILYNIPGRSGREIAPETMARLQNEYSNIVGVKEATGKEEVWKRIREVCPSKFIVLSGDDNKTFTMMRTYRALGVISVASNLIPKEMVNFVELGLQGRFDEMEKENAHLTELFETIFIDTNPIPVKEALNLMGLPAGGFRYPMCETSDENREKIRKMLKKYKLLKA